MKIKSQNQVIPLTSTITAAIIAVASFIATSAITAQAADEKELDSATVTAAKKLIATTKVKELIAPSLEGAKNMQNAMVDQQPGLSDDDKAQAKKLMAASMAEVQDAMSWENLEPMMVRVYAAVFSAGELDQLDAMFKTDSGQIYISKQQALQNAMMGEMGKVMAELMPKIQAKTAEIIAGIQAEK